MPVNVAITDAHSDVVPGKLRHVIQIRVPDLTASSDLVPLRNG